MAECPPPPGPPSPGSTPVKLSSSPLPSSPLRHRHGRRRHHYSPGVADYNARHRNILANSKFNLEQAEDSTLTEDSPLRSPCSSCSSSPKETHESQAEDQDTTLVDIAAHRTTPYTTSSRAQTPSGPSSRACIAPSPSLDILHTRGCCSSLSSTNTYPPRHRQGLGSQSSEDSHRTVPKRRVSRRRSGGRPRRQEGLSPGIPLRNSLYQGSPLRNSPYQGSPLRTSPSSPYKQSLSHGATAVTPQEEESQEPQKMYLETKINMLEIVQSGLQLKLDVQTTREQFLRLLEDYSSAERRLLGRPSPITPRTPTAAAASPSTPTSSGRARVRALYQHRRNRMHQRRQSFLREVDVLESTSTGQHLPQPTLAPPPSSDCHSDSTMFDEWDRKSACSGDVLDDRDGSTLRHNNSPSSEGPPHTNSPADTDPAGTNTSSSGGANTSSGGGNTSSSAHGGNITSSSDSTGLISRLIETTTANKENVDKENVRPEHYEKNNNIVNGNGDTQKLEPISEEYLNHDLDKNQSHMPNMLQDIVLPPNDLNSFHSHDIEMDENGYMIMKGLDPSLMDNTISNMAEGGGEAFQSRISGFSDFSHELPRFSVMSPLHDTLQNRESSIPIYTARNNVKDVEGEYVMLRSPFSEAGDYVTLKAPSRPPSSSCRNRSMMSFCDQLEPSMLLPPESHNIPWNTSAFNVTGNFGPRNIITVSQMVSPKTSPRKDSPKYAKSEAIKELYTKDRSLRDIGNISRISSRSLFNNTTMCDTTFGSTFGNQSPGSYPLNSTEIADISTVQQAEENSDDTLENIGDDEQRTFVDTSLNYQAPNATRQSLQYPHSMDESILDQRHNSEYNPETTKNPRNNSLDDSFLSTPKDPRYNPEDFVTPKRKLPKKPQLCKEHGVHPTLGGPCIFEDSFEGLDSSTEEEESSERSRTKSRHSSHAESGSHVESHAATDTDCDSSYLSECVDETGHNTSRDSQQPSDRYMYDASNGRMRLLRRQTGQSDINHCKPRIGLSESDLQHDTSRKHLSLEATRASLPDLANVATASECSGDQDATLKAADHSRLSTGQSSNVLNQAMQQGRPLSISTNVTTTTEESPESNGPGIPVPVNSPNATDSGSSRPTTDNYDYVDVPPRANMPAYDQRMPPPRKIPARRQPGVGASFVEPPGRPYRATGASSNEPKAKRNISGSLGSLPVRQFSTHCSSQESLTQPQHYRSQHSLRYQAGSHSDGAAASSGRPLRLPRSPDQAAAPRSRHRSRSRGADLDDRSRPAMQPEPTTSQNLTRERKKVLAKRLKQFNNNFHPGNLQIKTLGHF